MRKGVIAVVVVVLLAGGYATAQFVSSLLFERELSQTIERLTERSDLEVHRRDVERGWFVSHGTLLVEPRVDPSWNLEVPYTVRHGLLTTRATGELVPIDSASREPRVGDSLPVAAPRWHAEYRTLSDAVEARIEFAAFEFVRDGRDIAFQGGNLLIEADDEQVQVDARLGPLDIAQGEETLHVDPLNLETHFRIGDDSRPPRWMLETLQVSSPTLGIDIDVTGELRFLGDDWSAFRMTDLESEEGRRYWLSQLEGYFRWPDPPALVLLQLGLPLATESLDLAFEQGEVTLNGRPMSSLY
ncbi:DUF945 family protein [Litchfieldella xinjiangensis]|uniref:DUF945 family protein n=1 Tax=Litchfieldella xinjiangensis TaxID=1166948 RepID=UPI0005BCD20D|nr:DUF945 family protein [Halomonas xinjiangensis]